MSRPFHMAIISVATIISLIGPAVRAGVWPSGREVVDLEARPFDLRDVRLLDGPFRDAMLRTQRYLHELESERLLWFFRKTAGLTVHACSLAISIMWGALKPLGNITQLQSRGESSATYCFAAKSPCWSGISPDDWPDMTTEASVAAKSSGRTGVPATHTIDSSCLFARTTSSNSCAACCTTVQENVPSNSTST